MTVGKVKDFNFSSAGKAVGYCGGGMAKGYAMGGSAKAGQSVQMAKSNAVQKTLVGQKMTPMAKGGKVMEKATGENYPSRRAMEKHESMETPRMQRKEVMMSETVKAPSAPQGMLKNRGALGVIANKNPGETRMNTAPNLPGEKMMMSKGGKMMSKGGKMGKSNC
jgi:hypothetical protein